MKDNVLQYNEYKEKLQQLNFKLPVAILLDRLQSLENIALIARTAESIGVEKIYLCDCPIDAHSHKLKRISRSSSEKLELISLTLADAIELKETYQCYAIEITRQSHVIYSHAFQSESAPLLLVIGSETKSIRGELLDICKQSFHLPIYGIQSSINVACATSSALHWVSYCFQRNDE